MKHSNLGLQIFLMNKSELEMNKKSYSLLILGYPTNKEDIGNCFSMLTYGLVNSFKKLSHVDLHIAKIINPQKHYQAITFATYDFNQLPTVDFILAINYTRFFASETCIKLKLKCKKLVSFLEASQTHCDLSFVFRRQLPKRNKLYTFISSPYSPEFYTNVPKEPNTILLDHIWYKKFIINDASFEWSRRIWNWLNKLKDKYKIYSLIAFPIDNWDAIHLKNLPSFITPIYGTNFVDYLEKTKRFETFIVTYKGTYDYSIFDMLIRGIRVLCPVTCVYDNTIIKEFQIETFSNFTDLSLLLNKPPNKNLLNNLYTKCTTMDKTVEIIDNQFQKWTSSQIKKEK